MDNLAFAMIVSQSDMKREALSARPQAPHRERPRTDERQARSHRVRRALAAGLNRAAEAVAPPAECSPAH